MIAEKYLKAHGYEIISTNWTCRWGELDLIAVYQQKLIFVEVKLRNSDKYGEPTDALNVSKIRHLRRAVNFYLKTEECLNLDWALDTIFVTKDPNSLYKVAHFENVLCY